VARERTKRGNKCIYSRAEVHGTHSREYIEHDGGKRETEVQGDEDEDEREGGGGRRRRRERARPRESERQGERA